MKSKRTVQSFLNVGPTNPREFYKLSSREKKGVPVPIEFYRDLTDILMTQQKNVPSEELRSLTKDIGLTEDWARKKGLRENWLGRQAEKGAYFDALDTLGRKYGLVDGKGNTSFNKMQRAVTVLDYAARGEMKRLPKEMDSEIKVLNEEIRAGKLPRTEARYAAVNYFVKAPEIDIMKLNKNVFQMNASLEMEDSAKRAEMRREILGEQDRMTQRAERWIVQKITEGVLPSKAYEREAHGPFAVMRASFNKILASAPEKERLELTKKSSLEHFNVQQAAKLGREAHTEADRLNKSFKGKKAAEPTERIGPHLPIEFAKGQDKLHEPRDADRYEQILYRTQIDLFKTQDRARGQERKLRREFIAEAKDVADRFNGVKLESIGDPFLRSMTKIGRLYSMRDKIYQNSRKIQKNVEEGLKKKKEKRFFPKVG